MSKTVESANLFFRSGGSDKVYHAAIEEVDGGYIVTFAYGRRGASLKTGTKTPTPVPLEKARPIFQKLVTSKTSKGYQPGGDIATHVPDAAEFDAVASECQLLNPVEEGELDALLSDPAVVAQEKFDGKRLMLGRRGGKVYALNRRGKSCGFPKAIAEAGGELPANDFLLDGELVGETYYAFDLLSFNDQDLRSRPYIDRYTTLMDVATVLGATGPVQVVMTAHTEAEKRALFDRVRADNGEGVVFKERSAAHSAGRPASGGPQRKFKFTETATCRVAGTTNGKRSVALEVMNSDGTWIGVGNVTVPVNQEIPVVGALVEVRYLYAYEGGSLFQPVLLGVRDDLEEADCSIDQLKYKPATAEPSVI